MPEILATWDDFSGGHWGNTGPHKAAANQFGGYNMIPAKNGSLVAANSTRKLTLNANPVGTLKGMFWAWGADGKMYYTVTSGSSTITSRMYSFTPNFVTPTSNTISTISTFSFVPTVNPDWVETGTVLYTTMYGKATYKIDTATNAMTVLSGSYGAAPAGRCIAFYKERLVVGGVSDARFGTVTNRIHFSGDDSAATPNPSLQTAWESLNYFDIATSGDVIVGLYNLRDFLVAVMDDQSIYLISGVLGATASVRRVYGFNKGSGGLTSYKSTHGAVDPSTTRLWMFDHGTRSPVRFNGVSMTRLPQFSAIRGSRTGTDILEGNVTAFGGPDEVVVYGVAPNRAMGAKTATGVSGEPLFLERINGVWTAIEKGLLSTPTEESVTSLGSDTTVGVDYIVANDRYQIIVCNTVGSSTAALGFRYWNGAPPYWDEELAPDTGIPSYYAANEWGDVASCSLELPYRDLAAGQKTMPAAEMEIDGVLIDYVPRPSGLSESVGNVPTMTVAVETFGISGGGTKVSSGIALTSLPATTGTTSTWPYFASKYFPVRLNGRARSARVVINDLQLLSISRVQLIGKLTPFRGV